ncbi:MAG: NAD(P)H-hydrate dehydratase, partial [Firmicutes bacterium]|nr:NAD(P)H-hydrate dehydratase [Bacillota bacterium]
SAYRTGSGLVTVLIQKADYPFYQNHNPEVMVRPYDSIEGLLDVLTKKNVVLFGPGLKADDPLNEKVLKVLLEKKVTLVIDASGLTIFHGLLHSGLSFENVIVTPHTGEAKMLLDSQHPEEEIAKLTNLGITVVLKDATTLIANTVNQLTADQGNPGMATAGSGDVLAGMVASLFGQGHAPFEASIMAVYLHQSAGNFARDELGEDSMMASDIIRHIPDAIKKIKK